MGSMRWLIWIALLPGCVYFTNDGGRDDCPDFAQEEITALQRNPETLECGSYGSGQCDPACGPCPLFAPEVSWPACDGRCESLGETDCAAEPGCRVILDAECSVGLNCLTNFIACYPIDGAPDASVDCFTTDAWTCSRSAGCTAYHSYTVCPAGDNSCPRPFEMCTAEGRLPGRCWDQVACDAAAPDCPTGSTPGVANGCYSGACIPLDICEGQ